MEIQEKMLRALELARKIWDKSGMVSAVEGNTIAILAVKIFDQLIHPKEIRVEIESEGGASSDPARVLIYENEQLKTEITAKIEPKQGADGGFYPCVTLEKKDIPKL